MIRSSLVTADQSGEDADGGETGGGRLLLRVHA
jgi:hypothetical protein